MTTSIPATNLLASNLAVTSMHALNLHILDLASLRVPAFVCFATAHMVVAATRDVEIRNAYRNADVISPDGTPVAWALKLLGSSQAECVSGPRSFPLLLQEAAERGVSVGFYGGREGTLDLIRQRLAREYPALNVVYSCSPPFRSLSMQEQEEHLQEMRTSGVQLLFIGLGSPKQECWMDRFSPSLPCVCLGVGGAFEFFSGEKALPPLWLQQLGLTWLIRLWQEPRRLIRRNLSSPVFVAMTLYWLALGPAGRRTWKPTLEPSFLVPDMNSSVTDE